MSIDKVLKTLRYEKYVNVIHTVGVTGSIPVAPTT